MSIPTFFPTDFFPESTQFCRAVSLLAHTKLEGGKSMNCTVYKYMNNIREL